MKTAMQELIDKFDNNDPLPPNWQEKLLDKEKQQIIEAYKTGRDHDLNAFEHAGDYYYKKFNNQ